MNYSFEYIDIILLAMIAGFIFFRLRGILGKRTGFEGKAPTHEMISGAAIAIAALLLIIPGFATDIFGFLILFPFTRNFFLKKFLNKFKNKDEKVKKNNFIDGDFEDIEDEDDRKI